MNPQTSPEVWLLRVTFTPFHVRYDWRMASLDVWYDLSWFLWNGLHVSSHPIQMAYKYMCHGQDCRVLLGMGDLPPLIGILIIGI